MDGDGFKSKQNIWVVSTRDRDDFHELTFKDFPNLKILLLHRSASIALQRRLESPINSKCICRRNDLIKKNKIVIL